jgi:hypothetical protein
MPKKLDRESLVLVAKTFCLVQSKAAHPELFGVTDGKAVGTYVEHLFQALILEQFDIAGGNSAKGIDLPAVNTDIKVTSIKQPQSSCPFKSAREKIYGLDYDLLLFVYDKKDDPKKKAAILDFVCCAFIEQSRTADYQTTRLLRDIIRRNGNRDDVFGFLTERDFPGREDWLLELAGEIVENPPEQGWLTASVELRQPGLHERIVALEASPPGVERIV